ncbi:DUF2089 family protein [Enterococcus faecalis]|uniref:DUF2089 domain-containing protein n=1 Tax=Enterococcus faecalis ATCC 6055 TaxID=1169311 RepID=R3KLI8_ENTFL|nr:DUF2089 family protein [Enterococcus faecalis]EOK14525.1 hypothetical protein WOU_00950 [Enterococcus faecalis ATCC 6055]
MEWFVNLESEEQEFIKHFLIASGSLKQLAKEYDVSYPTVRNRLDKLIDKVNLIDKNSDSFEVSIMKMVIDEEITLETGKLIIEKYKESING